MRKRSLLTTLLVLSLFFGTTKTEAGGYSGKIDVTVDKNNAMANGVEEITVTVRFYDYLCSDFRLTTSNPSDCAEKGYGTANLYPISGGSFNKISISGSGNAFDPVDPSQLKTDSSGYISFKIKSTIVETKTITVDADSSYANIVPQYSNMSATITFTTPTVAPAVAPTTTKKATTTSAPAKPTLSLTTTVRIGTNDASTTLDTTKPISILPTQKLTFSGTTSANAKVTLTIKSDPITKEVTADANGAWTYTLDPKELALETGAHTVTAIATDTAGLASDSVSLASFELLPPLDTTPITPYKFHARDLLTPINYAFGGIFILLVGTLIFIFAKRRKLKNNVGTTNIA